MNEAAKGRITQAFGNLAHVKFYGDIRQGEVCFVKLEDLLLSAEVLEINDDEAKIQIFEDTKGIKLGVEVEFSRHLLEAELGPGLLASIFDGLQNPLTRIAEKAGLFLPRGEYVPPLDREELWKFSPIAKVGDRVKRGDIIGEVPEKRFNHRIMVPFSLLEDYTITYLQEEGSYTIETTVAKIQDKRGQEHEVKMLQRWPIKTALREGKKMIPDKIMHTGLRIIDTQLPLLKGSTFCTPGPFGAGKTVLQHHLSKYSSVDIVVIAACGERAGEIVEILREFPKLTDIRTNEPLINRTVIIANTSSMPVAARESSVYMGVAIAEYYRQMGYDVLLLADSTSRWAQAMREMSGKLEEIPGEEAFPPYLASRIAAFYERAGTVSLDNRVGSLTIGGAVSPAGGSFEEPVTQSTLAVVGAFLGLSRERSDARRYPAIDPLISWSKYLKKAEEIFEEKIPGWEERILKTDTLLRKGNEIEKRMEVVGEEGISIEEMLVYLKSELYDVCYLQQNAFDVVDAYCPLERQLELFKLIFEIFEEDFYFDSHDDARFFFLDLQGKIKNMNSLIFNSKEYKKAYHDIWEKIKSKIR